MDGLVYPDRRPHTGLLELKNVIAPVRTEALDLGRGELKITNLNYFTDLSQLALNWKVEKDGTVIQDGRLDKLAAGPQESIKVELPVGKMEKKPYLKKDMPSLNITETANEIILEGIDFRYVFNLHYGTFTAITYNGVAMISKKPVFNVWRAPTYNERHIAGKLREEGYDRLDMKVYSVNVIGKDEKHITICTEFSLGGCTRKPVLRGRLAGVFVAAEIYCWILRLR